MRPLFIVMLRNLSRNQGRVACTSLAMVVLVAIYVCVSSITRSIQGFVNTHVSETRLVVREKWVAPSRFPIRCVSRVAQVDGVDDWTVWHFFSGDVDDAAGRVIGFATRLDNLRQMHPGLEQISSDVIASMQRDKTSALVGQGLMQRMGWRVGQVFSLHSTIRNARLEFRIVGVASADAWSHNFFFRDDYYQDAVGDNQAVNIMWLNVRDPSTAKRVAAEVETIFDNSTSPLRVETESAGASRLTESTKRISRITSFISIVLFLDMVIVLSNSISLTVRERYREIAILKVLGFQPRWIITLISGEAVLTGALSGLVGATLAYALLSFDWSFTISVVSYFPVGSSMLLEGPVVGAGVGALASLIPAWRACRIPVVEAIVAT